MVSRPAPSAEVTNFEVVNVPVVAPDIGQVLVRNMYLSVDPYMFGRMHEGPSYAENYQIGAPLAGAAVGRVIQSNAEGFAVDDLVLSDLGWREYATGPSDAFTVLEPLEGVNPSVFLGALGTPGMTGYVGLLDVAEFRPGDIVFVSGAAGAVGSLVGQLAKLRGAAKVIGSAGSDAKVDLLTNELGFDAAFNYKTTRPRAAMRELAGDTGIDVYYDNVGGEHLEAALGALNQGGRVALCGVISQFSDERPAGPRNLLYAIWKNLTLRGFLVFHYAHRAEQFRREVGQAILDGTIVNRETVVHGIENAPGAFIDRLHGKNEGKMVVNVEAGVSS
jgi:NADPH-dependent curcumin reductase CurA